MLYLPGEFPQEPELCYLNHAAVGPWPKRTAQTVANFAQQNMLRGAADYPQWVEVEQRLRNRLATMIKAPSADDIAFIKNTSEGLSIVSQGLDWQNGDEVIGLVSDFPSNTMVWQVLEQRGVRYRALDLLADTDPEGSLIEAVSARTRLIALSTVHYATGYRFDMRRISQACRERGVLLCVDGIQSLGVIDFDLAEIPADFVTAGGHKWLLSPEGLGFLYCRAELRGRLALHQFGWAMRERQFDFETSSWGPASTARRFEIGTPNMLGIHAMDASLSLFEEVGLHEISARVASRVSELERLLREVPDISLVTPSAPQQRAGILTFRHARIAGNVLYEALMREGVICAARAGGVRFAPHFYTPDAVLQRSVEILERVTRSLG